MKKALFFDVDGTLWNAIESLTLSYNETMIKYNEKYRFTEQITKSFMGLTPLETVRLIFKDKTDEEGLRLFKYCYIDELEFLKRKPGILYDGVIDILNELNKKYDLYIVSNADKGYVENFIYIFHLENLFIDFVQAGDTGLAKWQNIIYLKDKHNIDKVIYIGDTKKDMIESNMAKVDFIHASYGFGVIEESVKKVKTFKELPNIIDKIFTGD